MEIVIITGMSGAGKSAALNIFEDMGYYCMDNLPPMLISKFAELSRDSNKTIDRLAVVVDIRGGSFFHDLADVIKDLRNIGEKVSILYMDSADDILIRRYKELRRPHPLDRIGNIGDGIQKERLALQEIHGLADHHIDTSNLTLGELKKRINLLYREDDKRDDFFISIQSFGYKNGILLNADLIFDVRFLPNPYYIDELKNKSGLTIDVSNYVMSYEVTRIFIDKVVDLLEFLIPKYRIEGKSNLVIGVGCTGGKHRSVAIGVELYQRLTNLGGRVYVSHRDDKYW